jgi:hypothetical protein
MYDTDNIDIITIWFLSLQAERISAFNITL